MRNCEILAKNPKLALAAKGIEISDKEATRIRDQIGASLVDAETAGVLLNGVASYGPNVARLLDKAQLIEGNGRYLAIACAAPNLRAWVQPVVVRSQYAEPALVDALTAP